MVKDDPPNPLQRLAKAAADYDVQHGGTDAIQGSVAMLVWVTDVKEKHQSCGKLDGGVRDDNVAYCICPVHGLLEGPKVL